jgi:dTDP-4-dehydrorhamnose reductase
MIMVTGSNGILGRRIVEELIANGEVPHQVDRKTVDLERKGALRKLILRHKPSVLIHCAALTGVDYCESHERQAMRVNAAAVDEAATAMFEEDDTKIVYISTDYVFDGKDGPYVHDEKPNPKCVYGKSKAVGEKYITDAACQSLIIRLSATYDARGTNFASSCAAMLLSGAQVPAATDQYVTPTLAKNAAKMIVDLVALNAHGVYHVAGEDWMSRYEFALALAHALGCSDELVVPVKIASLQLAAKRPQYGGLLLGQTRDQLGEDCGWDLDTQLASFKEDLRCLTPAE